MFIKNVSFVQSIIYWHDAMCAAELQFRPSKWFSSVFKKVSKDLPEKQKEIEHLLNNLNQLEQQLNQLKLWLSPIKEQLELYNQVGQPGAFDIKVIKHSPIYLKKCSDDLFTGGIYFLDNPTHGWVCSRKMKKKKSNYHLKDFVIMLLWLR